MTSTAPVETPPAASVPTDAQPAWANPLYAWFVVLVLTIAYTCSFIDRQILTLLIEPIRRDLHITDTQVSLLGGLAFSILYTTLGIPIARLADQTHRRNLMAAGLAFWSIMTATCGLARSFWGLFAARIGVGVGEAALSPAAFSLLADYFPPQRLARAISVYSMGLYFGAGLALMIGGSVVKAVSSAPVHELPIIGEVFPWQMTFFAVGLLGLPALLLMFTIREPVRRGVAQKPAPAQAPRRQRRGTSQQLAGVAGIHAPERTDARLSHHGVHVVRHRDQLLSVLGADADDAHARLGRAAGGPRHRRDDVRARHGRRLLRRLARGPAGCIGTSRCHPACGVRRHAVRRTVSRRDTVGERRATCDGRARRGRSSSWRFHRACLPRRCRW